MGTLLKIALRNTARHRRRTLITAVVMTAGISVFIFFDSMLAGMDRIAIDNMEAYTVSSLKLRTPAYVDDIAAAPLDKGLPEPEGAMAAALAADPRVLAAAPRLRFVGRLSDYEDEIPVLADAVDPERDPKVFKLAESLVAGSWFASEDEKSVILGAALAAELGVAVGDPVLVAATTAGGAENADEYLVAGLVDTPAPEIDRSGLFMPIGAARELLDTARAAASGGAGGEALVTEVNLALRREASLAAGVAAADEVAERLRAALPGLRADPISELARDYLAMRNMKSKYSFVIIFVVLVIAGVGIVNTVLMSVFSRIREIGVLRAYGMTPRDISRLFTLEGLCVGLIGSGGGVLLGALLNVYMIKVGIPLDAMLGKVDMGEIPISGVLRGEWNPRTMLAGLLFGLAVSWIAALVPARRAARFEPTRALRFV